MPRKWTTEEEISKKKELTVLYKEQNKTIGEISHVLKIAESTVFDRMKRLKIPSTPCKKPHYCNKRQEVIIPQNPSAELAEFIGIMLGDGHISKISSWKVYLTRKADLQRYAQEIGFSNRKHFQRAQVFGII